MQLSALLRNIRTSVGRSIVRLDAALMPLRCVFCGTRVAERSICGGCWQDLPWLESPRVQSPLPFTVTPLRYEFPIDVAIKSLKFRRLLYYAPAFGELLCDSMRHLPEDIDALLPVPLHWRRQTVRGFNQAAEICRPVEKRFDLPRLTGVVRQRSTRPQSGLAAIERSRNLRQAFSVRRGISARHVLIVDDVITTGTTTSHLARTLMRYGVEKVSVIAVARAR